jgi:hypothetical protein
MPLLTFDEFEAPLGSLAAARASRGTRSRAARARARGEARQTRAAPGGCPSRSSSAAGRSRTSRRGVVAYAGEREAREIFLKLIVDEVVRATRHVPCVLAPPTSSARRAPTPPLRRSEGATRLQSEPFG